MSRADAHHEQEAPKKMGFFGKAKLAVTSFIKGAVSSIPASMAYSAVAFTASAVIGQTWGVDYDFLRTGGSTLSQLAVRMMGASIIGGAISGSVKSYQTVSAASKAEEQPVADTRVETAQRGRGQSPQTYYDVSPSMTPRGTTSYQGQARI